MKIDEDAFGARAFAADPGDGHAADDVGPDHPMRCGCAEQAVPVFAHLLDRGVATPTAVNRKDIGGDRKSVVEGKSVSVRVGLGGRRIIKKKKSKTDEAIT